jgi:predicted RNA-binding protein with PIN domain
VPWIVDGMNVIGSRPDGWWRDRHAAMVRLVDLLERWAAAEGEDVIVMFEGPPRPPIRSSLIDVAHATKRGANAADHEIVRRIDATADPGTLRVVTSDRLLADLARARGAAVHPAESFRNEIDPR